MSVGTSTALIIGGTLAAGGAIAGSAISAHGATSAAQTQADAANRALEAQAPWLKAGTWGLGQLLQDFQGGTFGPGSIPPFTAPSLEQARETPGYQFTLNQGLDAITRSAAARGALGSGSTLKNLMSFGTGLADTTYNDVFNRSMSTYQAGLQRQAQAYNQLASLSQVGQTAAGNAGNLMMQQGSALAGGILGSTNAINQGISGASNSIMQAILLGQLGQGQGGTFGGLPPLAPGTLYGGGGNPIPIAQPGSAPITPPFLPPPDVPAIPG